jgi:protein-disulfide isomerase
MPATPRSGKSSSLADAVVVGVALLLLLLVAKREFFGSDGIVASAPRVDTLVGEEVWGELVFTPHDSLEAADPRQDTPRPTVVVFGDFECPACKRFVEGPLAEVQSSLGAELRVIHRHWPLPYHRFARPSAMAAECAGEQGHFDQMVHQLYGLQDSLGLVSFGEIAQRSGVSDLQRFTTCLKGGGGRDAIARDSMLLLLLPIEPRGTPTVIVEGVQMGSIPDQSRLAKLLGVD